MIDIRPLPLGALQTNCYLLICPDTKETAIIDPSDDGARIALLAEMEKLNVTHILLTHTHFDHVGGLADLKTAIDAPIYAHPDSLQMLELAHMAALRWHISIPECPPADKMLAEGDKLTVGNINIDVLHTPGHAPGHVTFYLPNENVAFVGDVLFREGVGRTDLPGCNPADLVTSIQEKLYILPPETIAYPGHGVETTIGHERENNPFVRA